MAEEADYQRVADDAPNRCQGITGKGQCQMAAMPGHSRCRIHGGAMHGQAKKEIRNYRLGKHQARVEEFADNDKVKSLREEIGIIRMVLEEVVNKCNEAIDLQINAGRIMSLVAQVNVLVTSCHKLEASTGLLLDKTQILQLADVLTAIMARYVEDEAALDLVAQEITFAIMDTNNQPKALGYAQEEKS